MELGTVGIFDPVRTVRNQMSYWNGVKLVQVFDADSLFKKGIGGTLNGLKKGMVGVAMVVSLLFAFAYSLITYPIRWLLADYKKRRIEATIDHLLSTAYFKPEEVEARKNLVQAYFTKHQDYFSQLNDPQRERITRRVVAQCALTEKVLAPVARDWVDHLLEVANEKAKTGKVKLIFVARDGIPYHKIACALMQTEEYKKKYPHLTEDSIGLAYLSRILVKGLSSQENKGLFKRYMSEELKIQPGAECLFADIGFEGSTIQKIKAALPEFQCKFHYLIAATTLPDEGYLGSPQNPLSHFKTASGNLAARWLEEPHHGNIASATKLVLGKDNRVHPNTLYPQKIRFGKKFSEHYVYRKFCTQQLVTAAVQYGSLDAKQRKAARDRFNHTVGLIKNEEIPLIVNDWDR